MVGMQGEVVYIYEPVSRANAARTLGQQSTRELPAPSVDMLDTATAFTKCKHPRIFTYL